MKSIYQKITAILLISFIIQIILIGAFYRQVVVKRIIAEINQQENKRQVILQEAIDAVQKYPVKPERAEKTLNTYSKKYNVSFEVKNTDGELIFSTSSPVKQDNIIMEQGYVKASGKLSYIVYGHFPAKINNIDGSLGQKRVRIVITLVIFTFGALTLYLVYRILANPLKKLSKAINNMNYGNTIIKIPYYSEDEFGLLCRNFEDMGIRLKNSEDSQMELVQAISHDIKTPLTSIIGYSKRLVENKVEEVKKEEYYNTIFRKANDLKNIVEELEDYGNINQDSKYNKVKTGFKEYVGYIQEEIKQEIEHDVSTLTYINDLDNNVIVNIDKVKLKRVFWNIVQNSLKYCDYKCNIDISCKLTNNKVLVQISDNGMGVPKEQINRIFDRFYRVDSSRSREKGGTGLGLAICKDIINKHEGEIGGFNKEEGGLCIWFTIPICS